MKIGILTLPLHINYGGILQAWALQTVLERMGHDVKVLSREKKYKLTPLVLFVKIPYRIVRRAFGKKVVILKELWYNKFFDHFMNYVDLYVHRDTRSLNAINKDDYDCYIVGSDQIWRPRYIKETLQSTIENAFLGFAKSWNVKRISYAASFGTDKWEYNQEQTKVVSGLIKKFSVVSVREKSGQDLCSKNLGVNAYHLLDPTMLLKKDDYISVFKIDQECKSEGNLMTYILDYSEEKKFFINQVAKDKCLVPFAVGTKINYGNALMDERIQPSLKKWLRGFYDAELVVTDSFHACVFSILFGKPFITIGNVHRGLSRFESLLDLFDLRKNLITDITQYNENNDYSIHESSYQKLDEWREKSIDYLKNSL